MATIKDIANRLGVSVSTVSKGLNGASDVSEDLRELILDTAVELGYKAKRMRKEELKKLVILVENMDYQKETDFGYDIVLGFKQMAYRDNWEVDVVSFNSSLEAREKYDNYLLKHGYRGAFILGLALSDKWMPEIAATTIPTSLLDNYVKKNPYVGYVGTDSFEGISMAVSKLYELGHRKIAFLNGSPNSMVSNQRDEAYKAALLENNLEFDESLLAHGYYVAESAPYHVPSLIKAGATAILCGNDLIAEGVIKECTERGLNVPADISVIGFDDILAAAAFAPPLTTIRQERVELGRCGYFVLNSILSKISISRTMLRPKFIERESVGKVKE